MTAKTVNKLMQETGCKPLVVKFLNELNGENYTYAKNVLDILAFYIKEGCYVDAEMAKSQIEDNEGQAEAEE